MIHTGALCQRPERDATAHAGEPDTESERPGDLFDDSRGRAPTEASPSIRIRPGGDAAGAMRDARVVPAR